MSDNETMMFKVENEKENEARELLLSVYQALKKKTY